MLSTHHLTLILSSQQHRGVGTVVMFQLRRVRHRKVKIFTQVDTTGGGLVQDLGHGLTPELPSHKKLGNLLARHLLRTYCVQKMVQSAGGQIKSRDLAFSQ